MWWWLYLPATLLLSRIVSLTEGASVPRLAVPACAAAVSVGLFLLRRRPWRQRAALLIAGTLGLFAIALASVGPSLTCGAVALTTLLWTAMFFGRGPLIAMTLVSAAAYWTVAGLIIQGVIPPPGAELYAFGTVAPWLRLFVYSSLVIPPLTASVQVLVVSFEHAFERERRARMEERRQRDELDRASQELEVAQQREIAAALASGLAHDMRNSLHVIGMNAEYLLPRVDDEHREMVQHLKQAADQTQQILRDLVEFAGNRPDEAPEADVQAVCARVEQLVRRVLPAGITVQVECGDVGRVPMRPGRLVQALVNLVLNAKDALPGGGAIMLRARATDAAGIEIAVSDGGIGMSRETVRRVFEPYFTTKAAGRGTGLGLFMVQRAVLEADGSVAVHSVLGSGTTFTLTLPRLR
jgi:signal transduction histidine kinase